MHREIFDVECTLFAEEVDTIQVSRSLAIPAVKSVLISIT